MHKSALDQLIKPSVWDFNVAEVGYFVNPKSGWVVGKLRTAHLLKSLRDNQRRISSSFTPSPGTAWWRAWGSMIFSSRRECLPEGLPLVASAVSACSSNAEQRQGLARYTSRCRRRARRLQCACRIGSAFVYISLDLSLGISRGKARARTEIATAPWHEDRRAPQAGQASAQCDLEPFRSRAKVVQQQTNGA